MKDPSIHIRRSDLLSIFKETGIDISNIKINDILKEALKYSIRNRVMVTTKSKTKKKVDRSIEAETGMIDKFNRIYMGVMLSNNIKVMSIHKVNGAQYLILKEVCCQALEFCKLFELDSESGFKIYIETGLKVLEKKFSLYRLKGYSQIIVDYYRDILIISQDSNPEGTNEMVLVWSTAVRTYFNTSIEIDKYITKAQFIHARSDADSLKADYYDWMYAQFEKWNYLNVIPAFSVLHGDNAKLNYQVYMAKIKNQYENKEEHDYFKRVESKKSIPIKAVEQEKEIREARIQASLRRTGSTGDGK